MPPYYQDEKAVFLFALFIFFSCLGLSWIIFNFKYGLLIFCSFLVFSIPKPLNRLQLFPEFFFEPAVNVGVIFHLEIEGELEEVPIDDFPAVTAPAFASHFPFVINIGNSIVIEKLLAFFDVSHGKQLPANFKYIWIA